MNRLRRSAAAVDRWQQRHQSTAFVVAVVKRFSEDGAAYLAALLAYFAFFSVFPLLLLLVTVLGFVLDGRPELQDQLVSSAFGQIPVLGDELTEGEGLTGSGLALLVGAGGALWGGLRVASAAQHGLNEVYGVPRTARPNPVTGRLRSLAVLVVLAGGIMAASAAGQVTGLLPDLWGSTQLLVLAATLLLNVGTVLVVFQLLTAPDVGWRSLLPGAVFAGVGYAGLQQFGGFVIRSYLDSERLSDVYGTFAVVIGLLSWFHLIGQLTFLAAEINVVSNRRLYPRPLIGGDNDGGA